MSTRIQEALDALVADSTVPGWSAAVRRGDDIWVGAGGVGDLQTREAVTPDTVFRTASLSKPIGAVLALQALDRGEIALEAPIGRWVPELDDVPVWVGGDAPLADTGAAQRPITVVDLLTMTAGWGMSVAGDAHDAALWGSPVAPGAAAPAVGGVADYLAALRDVPLAAQPGAQWRYHTCSDVLSVVLERALGARLDDVLHDRLSDPLALRSLGFWADPDAAVATSYFLAMPDEPPLSAESFRERPGFFSLAAGLGSNARDMLAAFDELRRPRTLPDGLAAQAITPRLTDTQLASAASMLGEDVSYALHVAVNVADRPRRGSTGTFWWSGGTGCEAICDPAADVSAVLLTNAGMVMDGEPPASAAFFDAIFEE